MPVGLPNPNRSIQAASSPWPSFSAIVIVPMFDDWERICLTLITSVPRDVGLVDDAICDLDRRSERERARGRDDVVLERAGDRHDLERRAGLVGVGDGAVAPGVG